MAIYRFIHWTDETGAVISTNPALQLLIDRNIAITAIYQEVEAPPTPPPPPAETIIAIVAPTATGLLILLLLPLA